MAFNGSEAEQITLELGAAWTKNFRDAGNQDKTKAHFFGRDILMRILEQDNCMGLRIYYALDDNRNPQLVILGADGDEKDQVHGVIAERSFPCPNWCDTTSALYNS